MTERTSLPLSRRVQVDDDHGLVIIDGTRLSAELLLSFAEPSPPGRWYRVLSKNEFGTVLVQSRQDAAGDDRVRLDHLQALAERGVVSMCFEVDGGFHVTHDGVGTPQMAARNVNDVRAGLDWHINMHRAGAGS